MGERRNGEEGEGKEREKTDVLNTLNLKQRTFLQNKFYGVTQCDTRKNGKTNLSHRENSSIFKFDLPKLF